MTARISNGEVKELRKSVIGKCLVKVTIQYRYGAHYPIDRTVYVDNSYREYVKVNGCVFPLSTYENDRTYKVQRWF